MEPAFGSVKLLPGKPGPIQQWSDQKSEESCMNWRADIFIMGTALFTSLTLVGCGHRDTGSHWLSRHVHQGS